MKRLALLILFSCFLLPVYSLQDSLHKRRAGINLFIGAGPGYYNGAGLFYSSAAPMVNLTVKARFGPAVAWAFGEIAGTTRSKLYYAKFFSGGAAGGLGYFGKDLSVCAGGGPACIFSDEYFQGGIEWGQNVETLPYSKSYREFGYCGSIIVSFNTFEKSRFSAQFNFITGQEMHVTGFLIFGFEFGPR